MFIGLICLILTGCVRRTQQEASIPVLRIGSINIKNDLKPDNNTEGYGTEIWVRKVQNGFITSNTSDELTIEVLKSTIIAFQSHISFHVKVVYFLNKNPIKTQVEIKGTEDLNNNFSAVLEKVSQDISAEILRNLAKDYGEMLVMPTGKSQPQSQINSRRIQDNATIDDLSKFLNKANDLDRKAGKTIEEALSNPEPRATIVTAGAVQTLQGKLINKPKVEAKTVIPIDLLEAGQTSNSNTHSIIDAPPKDAPTITNIISNAPIQGATKTTVSIVQKNAVQPKSLAFDALQELQEPVKKEEVTRQESKEQHKPIETISQINKGNQATDLQIGTETQESMEDKSVINNKNTLEVDSIKQDALPVNTVDGNQEATESTTLMETQPLEGSDTNKLNIPVEESKNTRYEQLIN